MKYIELIRAEKSNVNVIIREEENLDDSNLENLSEYFGVYGDEGDLLFLGSIEKVDEPISMYGFIHKNKACADIYNKRIVIVNRDDSGYHSLTDDQIGYFRDVYTKYPRIGNMPGKGGNFISN